MTRTLLTNQFLIAMPGLPDVNFHRSVSYVCEHNEHGTIAIIINRPMQVTLSEIFSQLKITTDIDDIANRPVYFGGPVNQERGFVIHVSTKETWRSSILTGDDLMVTTSQDILEAIAAGKGPDQFIVALGYAGWGADQIEEEITHNSWLNCDANADIIFNVNPESRWEAAVKSLGIDINALSGDIGHA